MSSLKRDSTIWCIFEAFDLLLIVLFMPEYHPCSRLSMLLLLLWGRRYLDLTGYRGTACIRISRGHAKAVEGTDMKEFGIAGIEFKKSICCREGNDSRRT